MLMLQRFIRPIFILLGLSLIPVISEAAIVNLREQPTDLSKIIGTADLSAGVIPIYSPRNSQWIKIADPSNGNTGWIKSSELKDSKGNVITFKQQISSGGNGQSVQVMQTSGSPLSPEQSKMLEMQMQQQEATAKETLIKAQKSIGEAMEGLQKLYQQQVQMMQQSGNTIAPTTMPPQQMMAPTTPPPSTQPPMPQPQQQAMPQSFPAFPPESESVQQPPNGNSYPTPNQMPQPGSKPSGY